MSRTAPRDSFRVGALNRVSGRRTFDMPLLLSALLLMGVGLMALYSEGMGRDGGADFWKQVLSIGVGLVPFAIFAAAHPRLWARGANYLYIGSLVLLLSVLLVGQKGGGAVRWIDVGPLQFQPSELAKLSVAITLSAFYSARQDKIHRLSTFLGGLLHVGVPTALILMQPHLGASLVMLVVWFCVSLVSGLPFRYLGGALLIAALLVVVALSVPAVQSVFLRGYQAKRIKAMAQRDDQGMDYQVARAEIAFGVEGVIGTGYGEGEQKRGGFVPEQRNDFIFTVIGEEQGLVGCTLVLAAYGFFFWRIWLVMLHAREPYYRMLAAGVFGLLAFHTFVNLGMVLGLLPVVGLWLPFLSHGGTAIWLCMSCVGLLLSVRRRERPLLF